VPAFFSRGLQCFFFATDRETWMTARLTLILATVFGISAAIGVAAQTEQSGSVEDKPYVVKEGKIDRAGFNGWRRYTESCLRCHGPDGAGSSYGPSMVDSLKEISEADFKEVVINGRVSTVRPNSVMPPFGMVEDVAMYIDDIYAYLKARSDGVIARGRPERFDR
jgi:mono/diheme cytochrome c family protein